ncbi:MAG: hypothetical protein EOP07_24550 [Proteobacteria bacterium]|nr:MAG: hypothetical protein EOP07_24550 [Pseudomonadota bacterium]
MKDESCEIKSTDSTKVLTQDQRDLLIKKIESLRFKAWAQPCNSDYATQTVEIMRSNSSIKYHVYLCKEGYYIEYEDFFDLLKTMNQLTT